MNRLELLPAGRRVERYQILDVLGQGGMAVVYRVRHEQLGGLHALKVVAVPSRSVMLRLMGEGRAQARVRHRNIVAVENVIEIDGAPGLVMEYVDGPSLDQLIQGVELDLVQIDALARGILRGVAAAHEADIVHRDLKPANVLVAVEQGALVPKVADFGLAKDFASGESRTRSGAFLGTPNYMSPEQVRDAKAVDLRTDLWSVGAILYELLTRRRAFDGTDMLEVFNKVARADYLPIPDLRPDVPPRMIRAVEAALVVDREQRVASAEALLSLWADDVPDAALQPASLDGLDPDLLARVRGLVSAPPTSVPDLAPPDRPAETMALSVASSLEDEPTGPAARDRRRRRGPPVVVLGLSLAAALALFAVLPVLGLGLSGVYGNETPLASDGQRQVAPVAPAEPNGEKDVSLPPRPSPKPRPVRDPVTRPLPGKAEGVRVLVGAATDARVVLVDDAGNRHVPPTELRPGPYRLLELGADGEVLRTFEVAVVEGVPVSISCTIDACVLVPSDP